VGQGFRRHALPLVGDPQGPGGAFLPGAHADPAAGGTGIPGVGHQGPEGTSQPVVHGHESVHRHAQEEQDGVSQDREEPQAHGPAPRHRRGGQGHVDQVDGRERIGGAAAETQQAGQQQDIEPEDEPGLPLGNVPARVEPGDQSQVAQQPAGDEQQQGVQRELAGEQDDAGQHPGHLPHHRHPAQTNQPLQQVPGADGRRSNGDARHGHRWYPILRFRAWPSVCSGSGSQAVTSLRCSSTVRNRTRWEVVFWNGLTSRHGVRPTVLRCSAA